MCSQTYVCVIFFIVFTCLWSMNMRFDTRFFAVASCMLCDLEITIFEMIIALRDVIHYLTAEKRLQVGS